MKRYAQLSTLPAYQIDDLHGICTVRLEIAALNAKFPKRDQRAIHDVIASRSSVVVDFTDVETIDTGGLDIILNWISASRTAGTKFCFTHCAPPVLLILQLLRIPKEVPVLDGFEEAAEFIGLSRVKVQRAG